MSKSYKELLPQITTLIFDVDGVFTDGKVHVMPDGQLIRQLSVKDSYAVQYAVKKGYNIVIMTGGNSMAVHDGLKRLGVSHIYLECKNKQKVFDTFIAKHGLSESEILYMGDDIPDYEVMVRAGIAACPADAGSEIKSISQYISPKKGGEGCVRDVIEQTLKVQNKWFDNEAFDW